MANGPSPKAWKPKIRCTKGFEVSAYRSKIIENIDKPIVKSDFVFLYMSIYAKSKITNNVAFIVEMTTLIV